MRWLTNVYGCFSNEHQHQELIVTAGEFQKCHLNLSQNLEHSLCYCYTTDEMTDQCLWLFFKWTPTPGIDCHSWWISKMQSGREDSLEEGYAIRFCFKLGKNEATETYGMLQTTFEPSCMSWASVFEWHKRFKESRESVGDDGRCGRSKVIRTPEFTG